MYCMERPGKPEGIAGGACLLNEISRGSHVRSEDKKKPSNSLPCLSDLEGRAEEGVFL